MAVTMKGFDKLEKTLKALTPGGRKQVSAEIGFRAPYAVYVHENLVASWRGKEVPRYGEGHIGVHWGTPWDSTSGEPKFLEKAWKRSRREIATTIAKMLKNHRSLRDAVSRAAYDVLNLALTMVPVDTGKLYSSGYVKITES